MALEGTLGARAHLAIDLAASPGEGATLEARSRRLPRHRRAPAADVTALAAPESSSSSTARAGASAAARRITRRCASCRSDVPAAFVSVEDARFYDHGGFDLAEIARSLEVDLREQRLARGGSTISQQLVKNAFLSQRRSFDRRLQEAVLAWRLGGAAHQAADPRALPERHRAGAARARPRRGRPHWFDVLAGELTIRQAAFLAALTAQPASMSRRVRQTGALDPVRRSGRPRPAGHARVRRDLRRRLRGRADRAAALRASAIGEQRSVRQAPEPRARLRAERKRSNAEPQTPGRAQQAVAEVPLEVAAAKIFCAAPSMSYATRLNSNTRSSVS